MLGPPHSQPIPLFDGQLSRAEAQGARTRTMKVRQRRQLRQATLLFGCCLALYCLLFLCRTPLLDHGKARDVDVSGAATSQLSPQRPALSRDGLRNLSLTEDQCRAAFPGLLFEIDQTVAQGPFQVKQTGHLGPVQGRIKDGQLRIIHAQRKVDLSREMLNSRTASLHQLHRAVVTAPEPLPDTVFSLNFQDQPFGTAWSYSRPADPSLRGRDPDARDFLMPHFSFWAWPLPFVGSVGRAAAAVDEIEARLPFAHKIPKAVWRGTAWFNSAHSPRLRQNLLRVVAASEAARSWADVEALRWASAAGGGKTKDAVNALPIEDFCRYKYIIHTEGVTYSGRFQFLQMCGSVVVTPPIQWLQHTTHMVRPLFSSRLDLPLVESGSGSGRGSGSGSGAAKAEPAADGPSAKTPARHGWASSSRVRASWPVQYPPEEANIVFVAPDWSDLEATIAWLEAHPQVAEGIARRQRETFVGGGYFSPAAETCYWRALVHGWARAARTEGMGWERREGVTFEEFTMTDEI